MMLSLRKLFARRCKLLNCINARHVELSVIASADDDKGRPSRYLLETAIEISRRAIDVDLTAVTNRVKNGIPFPEVWPGEHYKLLSAAASYLSPAVAIEIGTATGLSALSILNGLPEGSKLFTFDVIPWNQFPDTGLNKADFNNGRLTQICADVGDAAIMDGYRSLFRSAGLIFVDGPKDRRFESEFLKNISRLKLTQAPLVIFDDVRVANMLAIWREIARPKLDLTSFGHWSGTGLVQWTST